MILSQTAEYALRAVIFLAQQDETELVRVNDIAERLRIPRNYLSKILHQLGRVGILTSTRGKTGGFQLAVPAEELTLLDVVRKFDPMSERRECLLGQTVCSDRTACAAHHRWKETSERVTAFFTETTVADLIAGATVR